MIDSSFINQYDNYISYCILKYTNPPIEDYKQDIYLILLENNFEHRYVKGYISKIVRSYFCQLHRKQKPKYLPPPVTNSSETSLILKDTLEFINKEHGDCLGLYAVGYQYKEIANILNLSMSTVKTRIYRLRKRLHGRTGKTKG
jgi:RNA polymerase sigma-70 factor (ECF subfamily)